MANHLVLILPSHGGSGPSHWQSEWERLHPESLRVEQRTWEHPGLDERIAAPENAVAHAGPITLLMAHCVAGLLVAHWVERTRQVVSGAVLVAPPEPAQAGFPTELASLGPTPQTRLPFRSIVVGSSDDPYSSPGFIQACTMNWGATSFRSACPCRSAA